MKIIPEPIKNWFGYSRRERRSSFILLIILFIVFMVRYLVPQVDITADDVTSSYIDNNGNKSNSIVEDASGSPFVFNPNKASYDTLIRLGLSQKEAATLISYRQKGGRFYRPSDLKKVYGLDSAKSDRLIPFIEVPDDTIKRKTSGTGFRKRSIIDINNCDSAALVALPGIGPVLSGRIIKYRHLLGGFARVEQLREVYGLKEETYNSISSLITADSSFIIKIDINKAGFRELSGLPYFERYEITAVLKYRELHGEISGNSELVENKIITSEKAEKVAPYLKFGSK